MSQADAADARAPIYRLLFLLAAGYNIAFGLVAGLAPNAFFDVFQIARPNYPATWQVLGMVIGLYCVGYGYAAHLDRARPWVAIGLAGKVLGPIGWISIVMSGQWPPRTLPLIVFDDIVWWLPFSLFLLEGTALGVRLRSLAPYACAGLNLAAVGALATLLRPGTEAGGDLAARAAYVSGSPLSWRGGWALWIAAALSLVAFYAWWASRLRRGGLAMAALVVACVGLGFDLTAESLLIGWLPRDFSAVAPLASALTGGAANGLYTVAGIWLTALTPGIRGRFAVWTWVMWAAALLLTVFTLVRNFTGVAVCTAVLFALFCPWVVVLGRRLR